MTTPGPAEPPDRALQGRWKTLCSMVLLSLLQGETWSCFQGPRAAGALSEKGYIVEEVEPPLVNEAATQWTRLVGAEIAFLSLPEMRPIVSEEAGKMLDSFLEAWPPPDCATYLDTWRRRSEVAHQWAAFHEQYPIVLGPVSTHPPFQAGADTAGTEQVRKITDSMCLVVTVNLLGLPAVAVPVGSAAGVPQGVQLIGPRFRGDICLDAAEALEQTFGTSTPIDPKN